MPDIGGMNLSGLGHGELDALAADPSVSLCWSCNRVERIDGEVYRVCLECGHVYPTAASLEAALKATCEEDDHAPSADAIFFCPVCLHDF